MAISTGSNAANSGSRSSNLAPYYERVEPIDGGYNLARAYGAPMGQIRVFDDRAETGVIHCQFSTGRGKWTKVSTFRAETVEEFGDLIEALSLAQKQL